MSRFLSKLIIVIVVLAALGYLFVRSLHDTRTAPYTVAEAHLLGWRLVLVEDARGNEPLLQLQPPPQLMSSMSRQIFTRAMESQSVPAAPGIPLLLRSEFERSFAGSTSAQRLLETARQRGLEAAAVRPRCLGVRRVSGPRETRQLYFILFDEPDVMVLREAFAGLLEDPGTRATFSPAALSAVLPVAGSDADFGAWLPLHATPDADCLAPIVVG